MDKSQKYLSTCENLNAEFNVKLNELVVWFNKNWLKDKVLTDEQIVENDRIYKEYFEKKEALEKKYQDDCQEALDEMLKLGA